ncbi:hypothetical protein QTP86_005857 [Hemibagrus guttatus]|nr:hypothetical protein QTP86_005857 [Hemibagrus guttatus]
MAVVVNPGLDLSDGSSMYFHGGKGVGHSYASTRDIDLHREEGHHYWKEDFENPPNGQEMNTSKPTLDLADYKGVITQMVG